MYRRIDAFVCVTTKTYLKGGFLVVYLYSYQVQPLETVWEVAQSELVRSEP
jgi:hypothetical protein